MIGNGHVSIIGCFNLFTTTHLTHRDLAASGQFGRIGVNTHGSDRLIWVDDPN